MNIYNRYPMMKPFVGKNFGQKSGPSLLLVGESHYFPEGSSNHVAPEIWYSGISDKLNEKEMKWINTSSIIERSKQKGFTNRSHSIWQKAFKIINSYGPLYSDFTEVADDIAFFNFFLRPAKEGESLNVTSQDVTVANATFLKNFQELTPSGVVFLSRLAHKNFNINNSIDVPIVATPHPGSSWWNRKAKKYGNRKGQDILRDFVKTLQW